MVVREAADPGWVATVDSSRARIAVADGMFIGVVVPAGAHHIVLAYRPFEWTLGLALAALATLGLAGAWCAGPLSRRLHLRPLVGAGG